MSYIPPTGSGSIETGFAPLTNCSSMCPRSGMIGASGIDVFLDLINYAGADGFTAMFMIQIILVLYLYIRVGRGKYWLTIVAVALAGILAKTIENMGQILYNYSAGNTSFFVLSIVAEPFWVVSEFGVVLLNLIKVRAILSRKAFRIMLIVQSILFLGFCAARVRIGLVRYEKKQFDSTEVWNAHTPAFAIAATAEIIVSAAIVYIVVSSFRNEDGVLTLRSAVHKHLFRSTFGVLLLVDFISVVITIFSIPRSSVTGQLLRPFLAIKSAFALVLAIDAICIKLVMTGVVAGSTTGGGEASGSHQSNNHHSDQHISMYYSGEERRNSYAFPAANSSAQKPAPHRPSGRHRQDSQTSVSTQPFIATTPLKVLSPKTAISPTRESSNPPNHYYPRSPPAQSPSQATTHVYHPQTFTTGNYDPYAGNSPQQNRYDDAANRWV